MGEVIAAWNDYTGGHWGNLGPTKAGQNQWGGKNAVLDEHGWLAPVSAAIPMTFTNTVRGAIRGLFWAYGSDDVAYMVTSRNSDSTKADVYRFSTKPYLGSYTFTTTTTIPVNVSSPIDWAISGDQLYWTVYGGKTYQYYIPTNAPMTNGGTTTGILYGIYGDGPGGLSLARYGVRLVVGGVNDSRFSTATNRLVFSGDDTNNNPSDYGAWESTNYIDIGDGNDNIVGLYPTRDALYIVMRDRSIWQLTGELGPDAIIRRLIGYMKGTQSADTFGNHHGAVDPSQIRTWLFDFMRGNVTRFNGASLTPMPGFGSNRMDRGQATSGIRTFGDTVTFGGVDEIVSLGVILGSQSGTTITSTAAPNALIRTAGVNSIVDVSQIVNSWDPATSKYPRMIGNDRHATILATAQGGNGFSSSPAFAYWYADAPPWDAALNRDVDAPFFASRTSSTTAVTCTVLLPYKHPQKTNTEWEIDGIQVDYVPRPQALSTASSPPVGSVYDLGSTTSTYSVTLSAYIIGDGIPSFARGASVGTAGNYSTSTYTVTQTYGDGASDIWPNMRTAFFPCRLSRVRGARAVITFNDVRIVNVSLLGKTIAGRTT